jgi:dihydrofolate reductase
MNSVSEASDNGEGGRVRKVVFAMMTTLNGRLDDPEAWVSSVPDDLYSELDRAYATFDTILVGQTTYYEMYEYWPGAETAEDGSEISRSMARKMNSYKKFVFSRANEKRTLEWNNAEQVLVRSDEDLVTFINELKTQSGGDIHLAGGPSLAQTIIRLGIVDEFHFFVYPVVSAGARWFDQIEDKRSMRLLSATAYDNGVVGLYYELLDADEGGTDFQQ